jgi:DNA-binding Lrp family transcriptional regulator
MTDTKKTNVDQLVEVAKAAGISTQEVANRLKEMGAQRVVLSRGSAYTHPIGRVRGD